MYYIEKGDSNLHRKKTWQFLGFSLVMLVMGYGMSMHASAAPRQRKDYNVLIIHSYSQDYLWTKNIQQGLEAGLAKTGLSVNSNVEYLDTKNHFTYAYLQQMRTVFRAKYADKNFDLIIVSDNDALNFIIDLKKQMFQQVPVVAIGVNKGSILPAGIKNMHILIENMQIDKTLDLALQQHRKAKKLYVINDKTTTGQIVEESVHSFELQHPELQFIYLDTSDFGGVLNILQQADRHDICYLGLYFDPQVLPFYDYLQIVDQIAASSNIPVYVSCDFYVRGNIIGGVVGRGYLYGLKGGQVAGEVLQGDKIISTMVPSDTNQYMFSYPGLKNFSIQEKQLPPEAIIINKPVYCYTLCKAVITIFSTAMVILLSIWLHLRRRRRKMQHAGRI